MICEMLVFSTTQNISILQGLNVGGSNRQVCLFDPPTFTPKDKILKKKDKIPVQISCARREPTS